MSIWHIPEAANMVHPNMAEVNVVVLSSPDCVFVSKSFPQNMSNARGFMYPGVHLSGLEIDESEERRLDSGCHGLPELEKCPRGHKILRQIRNWFW